MAIDTSGLRTRRAILTAALGAAGATIASALRAPNVVRAVENEAVLVGGEYTATSVTKLDTQATAQIALHGNSDNNTGVRGSSDSGLGVAGVSNSYFGVWGVSQNIGVRGDGGTAGLDGYSYTNTGIGVRGHSDGGVGVRGDSTDGRGGVMIGKKAQLKLQPAAAGTHPTSGQKGDLFVDSTGRLWFCKGTTTWIKLA